MGVGTKEALAENRLAMWNAASDYWRKAEAEYRAKAMGNGGACVASGGGTGIGAVVGAGGPGFAYDPNPPDFNEASLEAALREINPPRAGGIGIRNFPKLKPIKPREVMTEYVGVNLADLSSMGGSSSGDLNAVKIGHLEEIIKGLQNERDKWRDTALANERDTQKLALQCADICKERDRHKEDSELRGIGLDALIEANKRLTERIARLEAKEPPKPNTRDTSRLGHFGEATAKQGLALFDRYY